MLIKKPASPSPEPPRSYSWPKEDIASQRILVQVYDWQYKVFPSLTREFGRLNPPWLFGFEGRCTTAPLEGLVMTGSVEVPMPGENLDHWKNPTNDVEGYTFFMEPEESPSTQPSLGATLYCQSSALDWIHRAFALGAQGRAGGLGIELLVDCPNNEGGAFWHHQWRAEWLRVRSWMVFSGAQIGSAP